MGRGTSAVEEQREGARRREIERSREKRSLDSGVDDQTPRQRAKQQREGRRQKQQRAALAVAEGGMPFIFSSLSCSLRGSLAHTSFRPKRALALEAPLSPRPTRDARSTEKSRSGSSPPLFLLRFS